jgi:DNA-binding NarL/FixJ family response regulator
MIHVALVDDHPAVLAGLRRLIEPEADLLVVGAAPTAHELAQQLDGRRPDVLIVEHDLARSDGLAHCRRVKDRPNPPAVIIYSALGTAALALAARAAQADAVVDKAEPVPALLAAVRTVADGGTVLPPLPRDLYATAVGRLADEDLPVLAMLVDGESLPAIAETLRLDRAEIAWRAQRIIGRLRPGASDRRNEQPLEAGRAVA